MIFDVIIKVGTNAAGKDVINVYRVHDKSLGAYLRNVQDAGHYIVSVIPLFRKREEVGEKVTGGLFRKDIDPRLVDPINPDIMIDPYGF
jgi:hypothetical protein